VNAPAPLKRTSKKKPALDWSTIRNGPNIKFNLKNIQKNLFEENLVVGRGQGLQRRQTLTSLYNDKEYGITPEQKRSQVRCQLIWFLFELAIVLLLGTVIVIAENPNWSYLNNNSQLGIDT